MTHPSDDEIAGLLVDAPEIGPGVSAHVTACRRCTRIMIELADVELGIAQAGGVELPTPPARVWEAIRRVTDPEPAAVPAPASRTDRTQDRVVSLERARTARAPRLSRWVWGAAAAALLIVAGAAIGRLSVARDQVVTLAAVTLRSLDGIQVMGSADLVHVDGEDRLRVHPSARITAPGNGYVEIWLLNEDGKRMVSVGVLDTGHDADLAVPEGAVSQGYRIVDLSYELYDDRPAHSGDSIMRGTLPG